MKYKVGDKVVIKTWDAMKEEFVMSTGGHISIHKYSKYTHQMEQVIRELDIGRVVTISEVVSGATLPRIPHYKIEESYTNWVWTDEMIECAAVPVDPINNRFEILDL